MFKSLMLSLLVCLLVGCQQQLSYDDLMHHPRLLHREIERCQAVGKQTDSSQCDIVMLAAEHFVTILNEQQNDPEAFGMRVMTAQMDAAKDKAIYLAAEKTLAALKKSNAPAPEITKAQITMETAKKVFHDKENEVEILQVVIGVNSPE